MLEHEISWDEVVRAGTVIFGPSFVSAAEAGGWRGELKAAYRRRVLETHPDRARILGRAEAELLREFRAVSEAYELLVDLRAGPLRAPAAPATSRQPAPWPRAGRARPHAPPPTPGRASATGRAAPSPARAGPRASGTSAAGAATASGRGARPTAEQPRAAARAAPPPFDAAGLPHRRLRMAEFLYYSGRVGWRDFVEAIAWQRRQRPAVGRIAVDFGFLARGDIPEILERRRRERALHEPFGQFAVRSGYLTPFQLLALLGQQLRLQRPIGRYFVESGLAGDGELDDARVLIFRHNARHAA